MHADKSTNPSAFPELKELRTEEGRTVIYRATSISGMTLRDYLASKATQDDVEAFIDKTAGEVAKRVGKSVEQLTRLDFARCRVIAKFEYADAMLAARGKDSA